MLCYAVSSKRISRRKYSAVTTNDATSNFAPTGDLCHPSYQSLSFWGRTHISNLGDTQLFSREFANDSNQYSSLRYCAPPKNVIFLGIIYPVLVLQNWEKVQFKKYHRLPQRVKSTASQIFHSILQQQKKT